jgi:hypothetical protein
MTSAGERSAVQLDELIVETRLLIETNRALREQLRARRLWRSAGLALVASLAFYAWSVHALLAENLTLLRANTELVQSGNALLRATNTRQQEMQSALKQMRRPAADAGKAPPRRRTSGCADGSPGCDSSTFWVPGFPGPRVSTKRTRLTPSI